jgi:ferritin
MAKKKLEKALNEQIKFELDSAYLYLSMASYCEGRSLDGFAAWMEAQSREEYEHAMKFYSFLHERGSDVELLPIEKPARDFKSVMDLFRRALENEKKVTKLIHNLYEIALEVKDYPAQVMLQWFIDEQLEEESMVEGIIEQLELAGDSGTAILMMDRKLGQRSE